MKRLACLVCLTVILIVGLMIGVLGLCLIASAVIGHVEVVAVGALLSRMKEVVLQAKIQMEPVRAVAVMKQ